MSRGHKVHVGGLGTGLVDKVLGADPRGDLSGYGGRVEARLGLPEVGLVGVLGGEGEELERSAVVPDLRAATFDRAADTEVLLLL